MGRSGELMEGGVGGAYWVIHPIYEGQSRRDGCSDEHDSDSDLKLKATAVHHTTRENI